MNDPIYLKFKHEGKTSYRVELVPPHSSDTHPIISTKPTTDKITCHRCLKTTGRWRAGYEYEGEVLCNNCGTIFYFISSQLYEGVTAAQAKLKKIFKKIPTKI